MLKRALWFSVVIHLLILLSISRLVLQPYSERVSATLAVRAPTFIRQAPGAVVAPKMPETRSTAGVAQASPKRVEPAKRPPDENFNFGRFLPSTVESALQGESVVPLAAPLPPSETQSVSAALLGQFRLDLARNARPYKSYPASARENGWEGLVVISVAYPLGGGAPFTSVERSSGRVPLDRQALDMVERALASTRLPEALQGRAFVVSLPIEYRLAE